jgi:hypothetical protein
MDGVRRFRPHPLADRTLNAVPAMTSVTSTSVWPREADEALPSASQRKAPMALSPLQDRGPRPALPQRAVPEQLPLFPAPIAYRKAG